MRKTLKTGRCHFRKSTGLKTGHYNDKTANSRNSRKCALREQAPPQMLCLRAGVSGPETLTKSVD